MKEKKPTWELPGKFTVKNHHDSQHSLGLKGP